jgi:hypothetical protein
VREGVCAGLLVYLLGGVEPVAAQTAKAPQAPASPTPSSDGALQWPARWRDLDVGTPQRRSGVVIAAPSAPDAPRLPKGWSFRFESAAACTTCPDAAGIGVSDGTAPWRTSGALAWHVDAGAVGVRVTGQRGTRLPLFMSPPGDAGYVPRASDVILSDSRTQWQVTLSGERRVWTSRRGRTLSLFGDLFLPLGSIGRAPTTDDVRILPQTAFIGGVRIRWKVPLPDAVP